MAHDLDRLAILAGRSWHATDLPGGLTNHNVRVVTDDDGPPLDLVVRCSVERRRAARHRPRRRARQHPRTRPRPASAHRCSSTAPTWGCSPSATCRHGPSTTPTSPDPDVMARAADACRRLHAGPRFVNDFDMFARQAGYLATVQEKGFPLPATYDGPPDAWADVQRALAAAPRPAVPCNNDLLAANFSTTATRVWLIDYEYSGNNDACFELGNTSTECSFTPEQTEAWTEAYFGPPSPAGPRPGPAAGAVQPVRLVALGLHPGRVQPDRLRLPRLGHGALREGRGDVPRGPDFETAARRGGSRWSRSSRRERLETRLGEPRTRHRGRARRVRFRGFDTLAARPPPPPRRLWLTSPRAPRSWSSAGA